MPSLVRIEELSKHFGDIAACDRISLEIGTSEIHALLGENGAGKSTLVKMLFGSLQPDSGTISWKGVPQAIASPAAARALGVGMVFQHFSLFEGLNVAENVALSLGPDVPMTAIREQTRRLSEDYGLPLDPDALVADLSVGERQRIEIVRCLLQEPELIILDEPTSVLTPQEADKLFETLERLRDEGKSILYISHRLDEVRRLCDRATVLRHGKVVSECDPRKETPGSLARMMVGDHVMEVTRTQKPVASDDTKFGLRVRNLSLDSAQPFAIALKDITLDVALGEIVGIAGVAGNGQGEFFDAISGERLAPLDGNIEINGRAVGHLAINGRRKSGAAFVPEERLGHGAAPRATLSENLLLARHATDANTFLGKLGVIARGALEGAASRSNTAMDVRKTAENPPAAALAGGYLQKFILGRELDRQPALLVVNQPTWGVDAGAAARIRQTLIELAAAGSSVLVISQDLDELFEISDRIAVMHDGVLSEALNAEMVTRESLGLLMGGAHTERHAS